VGGALQMLEGGWGRKKAVCLMCWGINQGDLREGRVSVGKVCREGRGKVGLVWTKFHLPGGVLGFKFRGG